jgi:hypothetical protein
MFITNHFNKKKENTISNQALCNIKSHSQENSIIQTRLCILQNSSMWNGVLQNISCHVASLSWSSLPLWWAQLAKSLTSKNLNNHAPLGHHTYFCSTLRNLFSLSSFLIMYASEYYSDMIIESKHTCIEFGCI